MASFGTFKSFEPETEPWCQYIERLEQYFIANAISDDLRKRAMFLTIIGPETYGLLKNLISPQTPTEKTLKELVDVLTAHFDPKPSEIVERFKFNCRVRHSGESVVVFIAELRRLAKGCNFGNVLDDMLRDRIVCGIEDESMQTKLLSESSLTLNRATEIAISMETAVKNAESLKQRAPSEVFLVKEFQHKNFQGKKAVASSSKTMYKCYRCGNQDHKTENCRFINSTCNACGKIGHIARICQSKPRQLQFHSEKSVHNMQSAADNSKEGNTTSQIHYDLLKVSSMGEVVPPIRISCQIQGKDVEMELDSGAPFSLIPATTYYELKHILPPLKPTDIVLHSYTKHQIDTLGVASVKVTYQGRSKLLPLLIVQQGTVNLVGRNWIQELSLMADCLPTNVNYNQSTGLTLESVLEKHKQMFSPGLGLVNNAKVHLTLKPDVSPKFYKSRPVPYALREKVDKEIDRLLSEGILEPVNSSPWAAPVVPVLKSDGSVRLCGDFKLTVNQATELEQYPLPKIEDLFAKLAGGQAFSKLDLRDAYCQLELDESSKNLVVINTHRGLFRYNRLPFGVASAPAQFQREIDKIIQSQACAVCYLDDILITGKDKIQHLKNLDEVLAKLERAGAKLHPSKCEFLKTSVKYLGHVIDKDGLHPLKSKLDAIENAPAPSNANELRSFLGLLTYYAKFLPNMATMLAPLYKLLESKRPWKWESEEEAAFQQAKEKLALSSLLIHFDDKKEVVLACDASPYGVGAVLSHRIGDEDRPIAFASRSLSRSERNYSHIEKEALALIFGVLRFRNYLLGREFTLLTDHHPLVSLLSESKPIPTVAAARIQRWALILSAYAYRIQYRKGALHSNADACSRLPVPDTESEQPPPAEIVLLLNEIDDSPITAHHLAKHIDSNPVLCQVKTFILQGWPKKVAADWHSFWLCRNELSVEKGIILRGSRIYIPSKFRKYVLDELHEGHQGISAIKSVARSSVWWPNIDKDIEAQVQNCLSCQQNASSPPKQQLSWPKPNNVWERVHIDHAGPVEGHMLLIVVDAKSKWIEAVPVSSTASATTIQVLRNLFARYGLPRIVVSDNGTSFTSAEFSSFLSGNGIKHVRTAPFHPNSNGQAERAVRTVKSGLKKSPVGNFKERLERFLFKYRLTPQVASGVSPSASMFGRQLRSRLDLLKPEESTTEISSSVAHGYRFQIGDSVWVRNYGKGHKWVPGRVVGHSGNVMLRIQTSLGMWFRHSDQVRRNFRPADNAVKQVPSPKLPTTTPRKVYESGPWAPVPDKPWQQMAAPRSTPGKAVADTTAPRLRRSQRTCRVPTRLTDFV